jgi:predicted ATPase/Tfp pilus assembly protein PilF
MSAAAGVAPTSESTMTLRVRMGLHSGAAEMRDGDYFGTPLNRAARIMSIAHPEQVLLSSTTAELVQEELPEGVTLRDMGQHRLRGLPNPERLFQVVAPGLRTEFQSLLSHAVHSLPAERDAFVGRSDSLAELAARFARDARLVSVLGIGGTGKTRLVTRFGWNSVESFPGGVWFCDLSEARTLEGIVQAVAAGLGVPLGTDDPVIRIGHAIAGRPHCLMIFDNFEQVARLADETLAQWLGRASSARFIVTTREVLGLPGEEILALGPLPPQDASALFVKRAEAAKPGFLPSPEDQAAIVPLVKLLDGLPLAIELAAARVRVMPPRTLLARMTDRFKLLSSVGGRLDRQATLRAVFDWSWDLLSLPEKAAFAQLSVFEAGFSLEAAEAVLQPVDDPDAPWAVDLLQSLVQKSLVRQVADDRFDLLVSVQDYAGEHLRTMGRYEGSGPEAAVGAEARHGAYFASLLERKAVEHARRDLDNVVVACRRAAARGDAATATKALQVAWGVLALRGPFGHAVELAALVGDIPGLDAATGAIVYGVAGTALRVLGKVDEARIALERSLALARQASDRTCETRALVQLAVLEILGGNVESAQERLDVALVIAREGRDAALESDVHNYLGNLQAALGKPHEALPYLKAALELARKAHDQRREVIALGNLGTIEVSGAIHARRYCEAALNIARGSGDRMTESNTLCNLGLLNYFDERFDDAREQLDGALAIAREIGNVEGQGNMLCNLGMVHDALANTDEAESRFEAALAIAREFQLRRLEGQILGYAGWLSARRGRFDEAQRRFDTGEALLNAVRDRVSLGILLCNRCKAAQLAGDASSATAAFTAAREIAAEVSAAPDSELGLALARVARAAP